MTNPIYEMTDYCDWHDDIRDYAEHLNEVQGPFTEAHYKEVLSGWIVDYWNEVSVTMCMWSDLPEDAAVAIPAPTVGTVYVVVDGYVYECKDWPAVRELELDWAEG